MALTVTKAVWEHSKAKGSARLVLLYLADRVGEERVTRGDAALAWPSKRTLAAVCNIRRDTVDDALKRLVESGEIRDTGERKGRNVVVWELLWLDWPAHQAGQVTEDTDLSGLRSDWPDLPGDWPDLPASTGLLTRPEPVVNPKGEPVLGTGSPAFAADVAPPSGFEQQNSNSPLAGDVAYLDEDGDTVPWGAAYEQQQQVRKRERADAEGLLADLQAQLANKPGDAITENAIESVRAEIETLKSTAGHPAPSERKAVA